MLEKVLAEKKKYLAEIEKMRVLDRPIILFGAGNTCVINLQYFRRHGIYPVAFCDNSSNKIGGKVEDLEILSFLEAREKYPNAYYYITTQLYFEPIRQQLLAGGVCEQDISEYDIVLQFEWESTCIDYYKEHEDELECFYNSLADNKSKKVLENRLRFLQTRARKYTLEIREYNQYFDTEIVDFSSVYTFADAGMYVGDSIEKFIETVGGKYHKIFGFEPDTEIYEAAKKNLKDFSNIVFIQKGTSDSDEKIPVNKSLGVMQTIEKGLFVDGDEGDNYFEVCKIDTYLAEEKVDMLKMDVEGAELAALKGARETIIKNKPILAICVYHKKEDIFEIPRYIENLGLSYELYLRHYSDNQTETVCYFIPKE